MSVASGDRRPYQTDVAGMRIQVMFLYSAGFQARRGSRRNESRSEWSTSCVVTRPFLVDEAVGHDDLLLFHHRDDLVEHEPDVDDDRVQWTNLLQIGLLVQETTHETRLLVHDAEIVGMKDGERKE